MRVARRRDRHGDRGRPGADWIAHDALESLPRQLVADSRWMAYARGLPRRPTRRSSSTTRTRRSRTRSRAGYLRRPARRSSIPTASISTSCPTALRAGLQRLRQHVGLPERHALVAVPLRKDVASPLAAAQRRRGRGQGRRDTRTATSPARRTTPRRTTEGREQDRRPTSRAPRRRRRMARTPKTRTRRRSRRTGRDRLDGFERAPWCCRPGRQLRRPRGRPGKLLYRRAPRTGAATTEGAARLLRPRGARGEDHPRRRDALRADGGRQEAARRREQASSRIVETEGRPEGREAAGDRRPRDAGRSRGRVAADVHRRLAVRARLLLRSRHARRRLDRRCGSATAS